MNHAYGFLLLALAGGLFASQASADDRLTLSANGVSLTDTDGGGGGSIGWLHNFSPDAVLGVAGEYQTIEDAQWAFGTVSASLTRGASNARRSLYASFSRGAGDDNTHDFTYQSGTLGVYLPLRGRLSMQLEDQQVDVDTTHDNFGKLGLSMLWSPRLQTAVAYTTTKLGSARVDYYGPLHWLVGGAIGKADAVVVNVQFGAPVEGRDLREAFGGFSKSFGRAELLVLLDYLELAESRPLQIPESKRVTLTLGLTVNLHGNRAPSK